MCSEKCRWEIILLLICIFYNGDAAFLRCYKGTLNDFDVYPLENAEALVKSPCFDRALTTVGYTFGYLGMNDGPATIGMLSALLQKNLSCPLNLILLDWQKEAANGPLGLQLSYALSAVPNAKIVGSNFGDALTRLVRAGMNPALVHLIGHSLGAHVMGLAGNRAKGNGVVVGRITGLDPSRQLFEAPLNVCVGLDRSCASFVDVIHTDEGKYGINCSVGSVDFWPNYGNFLGSGGTQPGCPKGSFPMLSDEDRCSHDRSWKLYMESIKTSTAGTAFPAALATNYFSWERDPGSFNNIIYMGDSVNTSASGNCFLSTGSTSPYSLGLQGLTPGGN